MRPAGSQCRILFPISVWCSVSDYPHAWACIYYSWNDRAILHWLEPSHSYGFKNQAAKKPIWVSVISMTRAVRLPLNRDTNLWHPWCRIKLCWHAIFLGATSAWNFCKYNVNVKFCVTRVQSSGLIPVNIMITKLWNRNDLWVRLDPL